MREAKCWLNTTHNSVLTRNPRGTAFVAAKLSRWLPALYLNPGALPLLRGSPPITSETPTPTPDLHYRRRFPRAPLSIVRG